jgi:hypothetical protein
MTLIFFPITPTSNQGLSLGGWEAGDIHLRDCQVTWSPSRFSPSPSIAKLARICIRIAALVYKFVFHRDHEQKCHWCTLSKLTIRIFMISSVQFRFRLNRTTVRCIYASISMRAEQIKKERMREQRYSGGEERNELKRDGVHCKCMSEQQR